MSTIITIAIEEAKTFAIEKLGLRFPISSSAFLKERARILKENHPDKGAETDSDEFTKILSVLDIIKTNLDKLGLHTIVKDRTLQGDLISTLGKGLGSKVFTNAVKCSNCKGDGYITIKNPIFGLKKDFCDCDNGFIYTATCKHCDHGKFTTKSGKIVDCKSCNGTGIHTFKNPMACPKCRNRRHRLFGLLFGYEEIVGYEDAYHTCSHCRGKGEIAIHNPVIPSGALSGNKNRGSRTVVVGSDNTVNRLNKLMRSMR